MHESYGVIFRLFAFLIMYARSLERVWALKRARVDNKPEIISLERVWAVKRVRVWCRTFSRHVVGALLRSDIADSVPFACWSQLVMSLPVVIL